MQTETINRIISALTEKIDVDKIFLYPEQGDEGKTHVMLILIANHFQLPLNDLAVQVQHLIGDEAPLCELKIAFPHQIREGMQIGNLYYYSRCIDSNLIYSRPNSVYNMFEKLPLLADVMTRAEERYQTEIGKIDPFLDGAELYHLKGSYPSAAFMLHQVVELTFRAIELFFLGKETRSHEISSHLKYLERHLPHPKFRFPVHLTADQTLFKLLEDAYLGVRYGDRYQISKEQVEQLSKWAKDFVLFVTEIKGAFTKGILQNSNILESNSNHMLRPNSNIFMQKNNNVVEPDSNVSAQNSNTFNLHKDGKNAEQDDLKHIVSMISESLTCKIVLCVGKRNCVTSRSSCFEPGPATQSLTHYDLLLIGTEQVSDLLMLQGKINDLPGLQSRVNLLAHTVDEVRKALEKGNRFFRRAMTNSKVLYGERCVALFRALITNINHQRMNDDAATVWHRRLDKAEGFLHTIAEVCYEDCFEISVTLIPQCLEQVCLGVIYVFLDYRPKIYNLNHLLSLCAMVNADFEEIIPRNSREDKRFYKIIADGASDIRYRDHVEYDTSTLHLLYQRCEHFVAKAKELCEPRLKSLGA